MKTYCVGDIHGRANALDEVLSSEQFNFDKEKDRLIVMGDICDGDISVRNAFDILLEISNLVVIRGNHDEWALEWMETGNIPEMWWDQGGQWTSTSYRHKYTNVPSEHIELLKKSVYFLEDNGNLFVHGGFFPDKPIICQHPYHLMWDREVINYAKKKQIPNYNKVFIGHTCTQLITQKAEPAFFNNLIMTDCGAGWNGRLCLMNVDTLDFVLSKWQKPGWEIV